MSGIVQRNLAWTCFATPKGRLTRCEHLNAQGGRRVTGQTAWGSTSVKVLCEKCGAEKTSNDWHAKNEYDEQGIQRRATATEIARAYQRAEAAVLHAFATFDAAKKDLNDTLMPRREIDFKVGRGSYTTNLNSSEKETLSRLRQDVWQTLVDRLEIQRFMSPKEWRAFERDMDSVDPPPITEAALADLFSRLVAEMPGMQERAIKEVFDWLRPRCEANRTHVTNQIEAIGPKVVIGHAVDQAFTRVNGYTLRYDSWADLGAVENVFCFLDGAKKADQAPEIRFAIAEASGGVGETRWFHFKCYRNGNLHLRFKRPDLVARINQIAGGNALRGKVA